MQVQSDRSSRLLAVLQCVAMWWLQWLNPYPQRQVEFDRHLGLLMLDWCEHKDLHRIACWIEPALLGLYQFLYIFLYLYACAYVCASVCVCACVCMCTWKYSPIYTQHAHTHTPTHKRTHKQIYVYTHPRIYIRARTCRWIERQTDR